MSTIPAPIPGPDYRNLPDDIDNRGEYLDGRAPLVVRGWKLGDVTNIVTRVNLGPTLPIWWACFIPSVIMLGVYLTCVTYLVTTGVGVWGNNQPVSWAFDIVNFVFWVGIGHAGTLISAILFLFRQKWRTSINRFSEAMTIFAVVCAGLYPALHVGRPWLAYWLFPIPNQMQMWPQFRSPLLWDVFAVSTYFSVSLLFWFTGMVPDLATLRDKAKGRVQQMFYGIASLGWTGSSRHWHRYEKAYLLLAALSTPLVLSVHSVVSFDFATSQLPGWHTTIFPPYFVAGAVFGGFAMVLTLAIPARIFFGLKDIITLRHIDNMCKVLLATGTICSYAYVIEFYVAYYSQHHYEQFAFTNRPLGPMGWAFWTLMGCNVVSPLPFWSKRLRHNLYVVMFVAMAVNIGMWFERFVIIVISLHRDFLPSSWGSYWPTRVDLAMFAGSFGLFMTLFLLFCRFLPVIAMAEIKTVMPEGQASHGGDHGNADYYPDSPTGAQGASH
jgi:molybdopterin-containing oxidoreductase family membrane subunit